MANLTISAAATLTAGDTASGDLIPMLDISATAGSQGSKITRDELALALLNSIGGTQGQVLYRGASTWAALATGTAGQVLTTGGAGANPSWASSFPTPLQATKTDTASTTSSTFADITGLTQAYTPLTTGQKVLVRAVLYIGPGSSATFPVLRLARDGTALLVGSAAGSRIRSGGLIYITSVTYSAHIGAVVLEYLDTPGTTSSVTYSVQWASTDNSSAVYLNRSLTDTDNTVYARTASVLTVIPFPI